MVYDILLQHGINGHCFSATEIPQGLIIGSRTEANIPVSYLYTVNKQLQKIDQLDGYKYSSNYDTIFVTVNVKNEGGIGSHYQELPIKVK